MDDRTIKQPDDALRPEFTEPGLAPHRDLRPNAVIPGVRHRHDLVDAGRKALRREETPDDGCLLPELSALVHVLPFAAATLVDDWTAWLDALFGPVEYRHDVTTPALAATTERESHRLGWNARFDDDRPASRVDRDRAIAIEAWQLDVDAFAPP